jgi:hypothetical protein
LVNGKGKVAKMVEAAYGLAELPNHEVIMSGEEDLPLDLAIGDSAISRCLTGTEAVRRQVKKLKEQGWPIFDFAGKRAARPSELRAEILRRERAARSRAVAEARNPQAA